MTKAVAEEDGPKESTTSTDSLAEEEEATMRLSDRQRRRRRWLRNNKLEGFTMMTEESARKDGSKGLATTTDVSVEEGEETTCLMNLRDW